MKIYELAFRFRYGLHALIFALGYFAPWNRWLHLDQGRTAWLLLVSATGKLGWLTFDQATIAFLCVAILLAFAAAGLRTWAAAFLGIRTVQDGRMRGTTVVAGGPYRYLRNPLYVGTVLHAWALAFLMPPSGAFFAIMFIGLFQLLLIAGEELFLKQALGAAYIDYCNIVPALLPVFRSKLPASASAAHWASAFLGEIYMWGVAISFLVLGWRYNALSIVQGVLISLGISLVARAFLPSQARDPVG